MFVSAKESVCVDRKDSFSWRPVVLTLAGVAGPGLRPVSPQTRSTLSAFLATLLCIRELIQPPTTSPASKVSEPSKTVVVEGGKGEYVVSFGKPVDPCHALLHIKVLAYKALWSDLEMSLMTLVLIRFAT